MSKGGKGKKNGGNGSIRRLRLLLKHSLPQNVIAADDIFFRSLQDNVKL